MEKKLFDKELSLLAITFTSKHSSLVNFIIYYIIVAKSIANVVVFFFLIITYRSCKYAGNSILKIYICIYVLDY